MEPYELDPCYIRGIICADEFLAVSVGYSDKIENNEKLKTDVFNKYETMMYCGNLYHRIKHLCTIHVSMFDNHYPALFVFIYSSQKDVDEDRLLKFEKAVKIVMLDGRILL